MKTCHEFTCIFSPFLGPFFLPHVSNPWNERGRQVFPQITRTCPETATKAFPGKPIPHSWHGGSGRSVWTPEITFLCPSQSSAPLRLPPRHCSPLHYLSLGYFWLEVDPNRWLLNIMGSLGEQNYTLNFLLLNRVLKLYILTPQNPD